MAWINIEVDASGSKVKEINSVEIMTDDDGEVALFETLQEADDWCMRNASSGMLYWQEEIWG
jgi:hypothetical protein